MKVTTFLMFNGQAEAAMNLYAAVLPDTAIVQLERYPDGEQGATGQVKKGALDVGSTRLICIDSPVAQPFGFTPAISLFVDCAAPEQMDRLVEQLGEGGKVLMPPDHYEFSTRFAWVQDRFGVSWQLNVA